MSLVVYLNTVNSTKFDQPMYTVIHMQDPGSVRVNQDHGSLASRVGSRVSVADPVPSLLHVGQWQSETTSVMIMSHMQTCS